MSQQNVEIVRVVYEAWDRDDFSAARLLIHPEAKWRGSSDSVLEPEAVYRGQAGGRQLWHALEERWGHIEMHVDRTLEAGDKVVTVARLAGADRETGAEVELPFVHVWELQGGVIVRFTAYSRLEDALEASGLLE